MEGQQANRVSRACHRLHCLRCSVMQLLSCDCLPLLWRVGCAQEHAHLRRGFHSSSESGHGSLS